MPLDGKEALINTSLTLKNQIGHCVFYIISDDYDFVKELTINIKDSPIIIATSNKSLFLSLYRQGMKIKKLSSPLLFGINVISQIKDLLLSSCAEGILNKEDRVLCIVSSSLNIILFFNVNEIGISYLSKEIKDRVDVQLLEILINLAFEISKEGKEGNPVGALFVVGDTNEVLKKSHQLIINPFYGHKDLSIKDEKNWKIVKEFASLDGAFIIDEKGSAIAAGRYINVIWNSDIPIGLGSRHIAAMFISRVTKAIVVAVSATGVIRVFKEGEEVYKIGVT